MKQIKLRETQELVPTNKYTLAKFPFEKFNPVQSRVFEFYNSDANAIIASSTSSGKTAIAEMYIADEIRRRGGKGIYLAPMKALSSEKISDWSDKSHHFSDLKLSICTGDYRITAARRQELEDADVIVMTSEILNSRMRNYNSENSAFLRSAGTIVVDECFPGSTKVHLDTMVQLPISKIVEDERIKQVLAFDVSTGKYEKRKILRRIKRTRENGLVSVRHELGQFVCTDNHKIWTKNRGYVRAIELLLEDELKYLPDHVSEVISVRRLKLKTGYVYDLEVEEFHNYFADGVLVSNCHLLTVPGRGDHLESGLIKFTEINSSTRIIMLSATMPNVDEVGCWLSSLTGRDTYILESDYRPCKLNIHYEKYTPHWNYETQERNKVQAAVSLFYRFPNDKFLFFVHTKRTGELLYDRLVHAGIECDYHNADLDKARRTDIEQRFKEDSKLRAIVATSSMAWGVNTPARRVVVLGIHRGLTEVENYDLFQQFGRAGRPQYDPEGDAYVLLPGNDKFNQHVAKLQTLDPIRSQMMDSKVLAFHIISEIHHGNINNYQDIYKWFSKTLAAFQKQSLDESMLSKAMKSLIQCGALKEENGTYSVTSTGVISSLFYYSPFDIADLTKNWKKVFDSNKEINDSCIAVALGAVNSQFMTIVSAAEKAELEQFSAAIKKVKIDREICGENGLRPGQIKAAYCYWMLLNGKNSMALSGYLRNLQGDFDRVAEVLGVIDAMNLKKGDNYFKTLGLRIKYGVGTEMVDLCKLDGIGRARARKLWDAGLRNLEDISKNCPAVIKALHTSKPRAEAICAEALKLVHNI